jgi:predicted outer membrane repeat protein
VKDAYKIKSVVNLVCRPEYGSSGKCVIDCPNTHFQIEPSAIAQFSGFEFRSATTSSIQVMPHGVFYSRNNIFVGNGSKEKGGAIYAQPNSGTSIVFTTFESNYASEGGAIYIGNKGVNVYTASTLLGNTFAVNYADVGGALYIDERVKLTLIKNTFYGNYIDLEGGLGPAIYYAGFLAKSCHGNYGCDNGRTLCDGGWNAAIQKCEPFETVCTYNPPTKEPTSPTGSPTRNLTLTPTLHPTMAPTNSNLPSVEPTISPSKFPSPTPTVTKSNAPSFSNAPSQRRIPTPTPTSISSISPSNKPKVAESPSPSGIPTKLHSEDPSYSNIPTQSLSDSPSAVPKKRKL